MRLVWLLRLYLRLALTSCIRRFDSKAQEEVLIPVPVATLTSCQGFAAGLLLTVLAQRWQPEHPFDKTV